jgi:hypothetical protein
MTPEQQRGRGLVAVDRRDVGLEDLRVRSGLLIARVAFVAVVAAFSFPSDGAADGQYVSVALTATGPSPSTVRMYPISDLLVFVNQDSVAHTVVFADGNCSPNALNVLPGEQAHCTGLSNPQNPGSRWPHYVGSYAYTSMARSLARSMWSGSLGWSA